MSEPVIRVQGLSKQYRLGSGLGGARLGYRTFQDVLMDAARYPLRLMKSFTGEKGAPVSSDNATLWALRNVSFEVNQGEVVGIIGRNGAGKSTLLKILSRITKPTEGRAELRGRVGSLLEVGTGFHPELTGHENIYLYGSILGMKRQEIAGKYDEIVAFAELEKFVDTPVKRYSSGMYTRLAFAVAAHLEPEILLVDEVLAVGDAAFQKKCMGRMGDVARQGRTVLFVSHNMHAVISLCSRALLLEDGCLTLDGPVLKVTDKHIENCLGSEQEGEADLSDRSSGRVSPGTARVLKLRTLDQNENVCKAFEINSPLTLEAMLGNLSPQGFVLSFSIMNRQGVCLYHIRSQDSPLKTEGVGSQAVVRMTIPQLRIVEGTYSIRIWLGNHLDQLEDKVDDAMGFRVDDRGQSSAELNSVIHEPGQWSVKGK